jgi:aminoglycoside 6'-N-acetyltransferase I
LTPPVEVRLLSAADTELILSAADGVFDDAAEPALTAKFLEDPRHHIVAAVVEGRLVGFASAVHYIHPDKPPELWINEVGVAPAYQRQGVGRRLIDALLAHGRALGCKEAWVLTEHDNEAARALYRSAGASEETVVYCTFPLDQ